MAATRGIDVRVVGRLIEHPLTTLLFIKPGRIAKPADLNGETIGYTVPGLMDVLMDTFAKVNRIRDYQLVNVGFSIECRTSNQENEHGYESFPSRTKLCRLQLAPA